LGMANPFEPIRLRNDIGNDIIGVGGAVTARETWAKREPYAEDLKNGDRFAERHVEIMQDNGIGARNVATLNDVIATLKA